MALPSILVLQEDEPLVIPTLARQAIEIGVSVIYSFASRVLELAGRYRPSLIVLDLGRETDGRDVVARLKQDERTRDLEVIVLSENDDPRVIAECFRMGISEYELKPFSKESCHRIAERALLKHRFAHAALASVH